MTSLYLNHIASDIYILNRNAQCHFTSHLFSFFDSPFFNKREKKKTRMTDCTLMPDTSAPSFLLLLQMVLTSLWGCEFVSNDPIGGTILPFTFPTRTDGIASGEHQVYLNVIPSHDFWRWSKVDIEPEEKCTVVMPRQNPTSSYT